jgi:hypothetical protein
VLKVGAIHEDSEKTKHRVNTPVAADDGNIVSLSKALHQFMSDKLNGTRIYDD